jgi:hypothetical protein
MRNAEQPITGKFELLGMVLGSSFQGDANAELRPLT